MAVIHHFWKVLSYYIFNIESVPSSFSPPLGNLTCVIYFSPYSCIVYFLFFIFLFCVSIYEEILHISFFLNCVSDHPLNCFFFPFFRYKLSLRMSRERAINIIFFKLMHSVHTKMQKNNIFLTTATIFLTQIYNPILSEPALL